MQVSVAKSDVLSDLRQRAKRFENHLTNPASQAAHATLSQQIDLLEHTPGETVGQVRTELLAQAAQMASGRNRLGLASAAMLGTMATSLVLTGGPGGGGWTTGLNVVCLLGGAMTGILAVDRHEKTSWLKGQAESLQSFLPASSYSGNGNLVGQPTEVDLSGPASVAQLRGLLEATRGSLAEQPQPELEAARKQVESDLKELGRYPAKSLDDLRAVVRQQDESALPFVRFAPWGLGGSLATIAVAGWHWALAPVGAGMMLATMGALMYGANKRGNARQVEIMLNRWEMQLQSLKEIHQAGQEMRDWKTVGAGSTVKEDAMAVVVGGVRVPVRARKE